MINKLREVLSFRTIIQTIRNYFSYRIYVWELYKKRARKEGWKKRIGITISYFFKTHPSNLRRWLIIFRPFGFAQDQDRFDDWNYHLYFISQKFLSKRWCSKVHGEDAGCAWHYYKPFTIRAHYCQTIGQDREYPEYEITKHTFLERKFWEKDWRVYHSFENNEAYWLKPYEDYLYSGGLEGGY